MNGVIHNTLRTLRFLNGEMSQAELGRRIGLTRQTVAAIEAGKYSPSLEAAFRIADVFGVCLLYTSPSPRDGLLSRMPSSA